MSLQDLFAAASTLGGPSSVPRLRDVLLSLQPLLLRVNPGTAAEMVGLRHSSIAAHFRSRQSPHIEENELWLLVDVELALERQEELLEHLDECTPCLELLARVERLKRLFARAGGDRAPQGLHERIRAGVFRMATGQAGMELGEQQESQRPRT
ncbi:hypothetical protein [Kibdelosporangium aridum]|nr:hypothetical protein [Kibdelosporangium aridum]